MCKYEEWFEERQLVSSMWDSGVAGYHLFFWVTDFCSAQSAGDNAQSPREEAPVHGYKPSLDCVILLFSDARWYSRRYMIWSCLLHSEFYLQHILFCGWFLSDVYSHLLQKTLFAKILRRKAGEKGSTASMTVGLLPPTQVCLCKGQGLWLTVPFTSAHSQALQALVKIYCSEAISTLAADLRVLYELCLDR